MRAGESANRILVAGIGNIFLGDDAFGCEVIRAWSAGRLPAGVEVEDFGIRSYDLACALAGDYEAVVLVDALSRGEAPGTVFLFEPDLGALEKLESPLVDPHTLEPMQVLHLAASMGAQPQRVYLVGCEPAVLETEELGLSAAVQAAVPTAIQMLESLVKTLLGPSQVQPLRGDVPAPLGVIPR